MVIISLDQKCITSILKLIPNNNDYSLKFENDSLSKFSPYRIINIGNSSPINLMEYIAVIEEKLGKKAKKRYLDREKGEVKDTWSDISLLRSLNGFNPKISIYQGVENFINWYKKYYKLD